ncbi:MAG: alpha-L-rhamnosidase N-terminal domain-containing protein [Limisphaerales bacterium]
MLNDLRFRRLVRCLLAGWVAPWTIASAASNDGGPFPTARWIAPPSVERPHYGTALLRREFSVERLPRRATLRIVGLGDYDPTVNGQRLSPVGINQPWSQYERTLYYREFDLRPHLRRGANCLGVTLTHSFWDNAPPPKGRYFKHGPQRKADEPLLLLAEVELERADGSIVRLASDEHWRTSPGPIVFSHIFAGEDFDARRTQPGWDRPGFDAGHWSFVRTVAAPPGELLPQTWPPVLPRERFAPTRIAEPAPGVWLYEFPQNCSAQLRVVLSGGQSGQSVKFRSGEHKNGRDRLFGHYVVGTELVTDGRRLTNQWNSFYLGMQFVEVTNAVPKGKPNPNGLPVIESLELIHVRTALPEAGTFTSSSPVFNGTHRVVDWAMQANANHVLTDCPHREKLGWLEVAYLMAPSFLYRYDSDAWFQKILRDIRDAQEPSGRVLTVAPSYPAGRFPDKFNWTVEWGAAAALLPWHLYEWSGDPAVLRENFPMMRRFTDYIGTEAKDGLAPGGLGDWYDYGHGKPPGESRFTPTELTATATWALCARTVARAAEVLEQPEEARRYHELHARIAADFQRHFLDPATGRLRHRGSPQCANAIALEAEVVPAGLRPSLVEDIIADLAARDWQQTPGDIGHVYFIRALAGAGRSDVLHKVYSREGKGSYGGILAKGLTSMPETWDAMMDGYQSLNHCMLGHVMEWFYAHVGGIRQQPGTVGWKDVLIAPAPGPLTRARAEVRTPAGLIVSDWNIQGGRFRLTTQVPKGVKATVVLPSGAAHLLRPGRQIVSEPWPGGGLAAPR